MGAAVKFLSAEFSREESKGSFAEGREDRVGNLGFWRVWRKDSPPLPQTLTGIDCLAGLSGEGRRFCP